MKKLFAALLSAAMLLSLVSCGGDTATSPAPSAPAAESESVSSTFKAAMVTDVGGINDQSYNSMSWAGMQKAHDELGIDVKYYESKTDADYDHRHR